MKLAQLAQLAQLAALALVVAACGTPALDDASDTTETTAAPTTTTEAPLSIQLAYGYQPDTQISYRVSLDQAITIVADGDEAAFGGEELPIDGDVATSVETVMTYEVYPGPTEDTTELVISATFDDVSVTGSMNGEAFTPAEDQLGLASIPPIEASFVIDASGKVISSSLDQLAPAFGAGLDSLQGLSQDSLAKPIGPEFPEDELKVGTTWTQEQTIDGPDGPITTKSTHEVLRTEEVDGVETFVIRSMTDAEAFEIDFTTFLKAMFEGMADFAPAEGGQDIEAILEQLEFRIAVSPANGTATTWFDPEAGLVRKAESSQNLEMAITFRGPDETTGEIVGFTMEMGLTQRATFDLESVGDNLS